MSDEEGKNKSEMIGYLELRGLLRFLGARRRSTVTLVLFLDTNVFRCGDYGELTLFGLFVIIWHLAFA